MYQAVGRDPKGEVMSNQSANFSRSFHKASAFGTIIYHETQSCTNNQFGLAILEIGNGAPGIGTFPGINWGNSYKFLEIEINPAAGSIGCGSLRRL